MMLFLRVSGCLVLLGAAGFCVFGFLASQEPSASPRWPWQVGYGLVGSACLAAAIRLALGRGPGSRRRPRSAP